MKPDFDRMADDLQRRSQSPFTTAGKTRDLIRVQLALAYQEGICDGLRQSETAIKAAFDRYQGRVEP